MLPTIPDTAAAVASAAKALRRFLSLLLESAAASSSDSRDDMSLRMAAPPIPIPALSPMAIRAPVLSKKMTNAKDMTTIRKSRLSISGRKPSRKLPK